MLILSLFLSISVSASDMPISVYLKPSLTLTIPASSLDLTLDPSSKSFDSSSINLEVGTNNASGYKLYISTGDNNTELINTIDSSATIPTLTSSASESDFPANHWGYKIGANTDYLPFTSGALVNSSNIPVNRSTTTFTLGAKINYTMAPGIYKTNLEFTTVPSVAMHYMQDLEDPAIAQRVCVSDGPAIVIDKRDNKSYYIQRLKDGRCWMIQNLRLGEDLTPVIGAITLTSNDSNVTSDFILTNKVADGKMPAKSLNDPVTGSIGWIWDGPAFYCTESYGCYYNHYTATAGVKAEGHDAIVTSNMDVDNSVCPKGWVLPSSGMITTDHTSDFETLANAYGYGITTTKTDTLELLVNPTTSTENNNGSFAPGFLLGGNYGSSGSENINVYGHYWSRTIYSVTANYLLVLNESVFGFRNHLNRFSGRSVRCLLQE